MRPSRFRSCSASWAVAAVLGLTLCASQSGCVERRMLIRSNPPGALVYVDDQATPIGVTPVGHNFTYYGTRKFRLVKDGCETLTEMRSIPPPWYEYPVLDFVSENFVPGQIRDTRVLDFQLQPQAMVPTDQLLARAEDLRRGVHAATGTATRAAPPAGPEVIQSPEGIGGQRVRLLPPP
jgi:hypothetical protein